ncbi:MAG TPA: hypothetical protein VFE31_08260, partial [Opitutaceae bacterium]|nr:hypothetical protein [Opitutaceae bacterium]
MPSSPNRREFIQAAGGALAGAYFLGLPAAADAANASSSAYEWIRRARIVIAEGYNAPFYPVFDYRPARAVRIAQDLNADAFRFPAAAYCAYFPTRSGYPIHPELKEDVMRDTLAACRNAGMRPVGYVPLNHPFMAVTSRDARYADWTRKFADGLPMTTSHYGYGRFFEGCLSSPLRRVIKTMVREVLVEYPFDVLFFDGPYEGSENGSRYCHCRYCEAAYRAKFGRPVPDDRTELSREDQVQYVNWMANDVVIAFLREIREMIRRTRDVPVLFNDTALLSRRQWRNRAIPAADGFMFEASDSPESKLFNLQLGRSTGKAVWTYLGSYAEYNQEHLQDRSVRGWYSYPLEGEELLMDGAVAVTGGAGLLYWSMSRFYFQPYGPLAYPSGRYIKRTFDLQRRHGNLLRSVEIR